MIMREFKLGNIFIREVAELKTGDVIPGHTHEFDHVTQWLEGDYKVDAKLPTGVVIVKEFTSPSFVLIRKDVKHTIRVVRASGNGKFWCVYSHRDPRGYVVPDYTGWPKAYT